MSELAANDLKGRLAGMIGEILMQEIDPDRPEASLIDDYGANSMDLVDIVIRLEQKLDVKISNGQVPKLKTFGDILQIVLDQKLSPG